MDYFKRELRGRYERTLGHQSHIHLPHLLRSHRQTFGIVVISVIGLEKKSGKVASVAASGKTDFSELKIFLLELEKLQKVTARGWFNF